MLTSAGKYVMCNNYHKYYVNMMLINAGDNVSLYYV